MARIFITHSSKDYDAAARMEVWLKGQGFENAFLDKDQEHCAGRLRGRPRAATGKTSSTSRG